MGPARQPVHYQFGSFVYSDDTGELRKSGVTVRLAPQPASVLKILLARNGGLVTREELQQVVWKGDTIVDFELGLNRCVARIRSALGDDADTPRYIETIPRLGYRFIAPVNVVAAPSRPEIVMPAPPPVIIPETNPMPAPKAPEAPASPVDAPQEGSETGFSRKWRNIFLYGGSLAALLSVALWYWPRPVVQNRTVPIRSDYSVGPLFSEPGQAASPSFSPDGSRVVFTWNGSRQDNFDLYMKAVGSQEVSRLTRTPEPEYSPAWSPDGKSIAFCRGGSQNDSSIWLISPDGGTERKLADLTWTAVAGSRFLTWSPDSKRLVFAGSPKGDNVAGLLEIDVATGASRYLTRAPAGTVEVHPAYAPDGHAVAFVRDIARGIGRILILPMKKDGGAAGPPVPLLWPGFESSHVAKPVWTSDSSHLFFASNRNSEQYPWVVKAEPGAAPRLFSALGAGVMDAAISSTGDLAMVRERLDIDILRIDLGRLRRGESATPQPVVNSNRLETYPNVSADGLKLAFESNRSGFMEVWTANVDGTNLAQLTNMSHPITGSPAWSPDNRFIAFDSRAGGVPRIYRVPAAGGKVEALTTADQMSVAPAWSSDGAWIYFTSDRTGRPEIWRIPPSGGTPQQISKTGGFSPATSSGKLILYSADRSWITTLKSRNVETQEEKILATDAVRRSYCLSGDGVYYIATRDGEHYSLKFLRQAGGAAETLYEFPRRIAEGMSMSRDGNSVFFGEAEHSNTDMQFVREFWRK